MSNEFNEDSFWEQDNPIPNITNATVKPKIRENSKSIVVSASVEMEYIPEDDYDHDTMNKLTSEMVVKLFNKLQQETTTQRIQKRRNN